VRRLLIALVLVLAAPVGASTAPVSVALPSVEPLTGGVHGRPFMGLLSVPKGFVQEEYLVRGTARPAYGLSVFAQRPVPGTSALPPLPYAVRIVVVRPVGRSNETALVTRANVTFGHDIGEWFNVGRQVVADRYTYVEASVQLASVPALKAFDPVRYAPLLSPGDAYSYDIYSQVAKALRHGFGAVPRQRYVLAMGASQSGFALDQYLDAVQPRYERVYDGFLVKVSNGPDHHTDRPVMRLLSEDEIDGSSDSPDGRTYRQWEIAGTAHGNKDDFDYIAATEERDLGVDLVDPLAGDNAPFGLSSCQMNRFPAAAGHNAAVAALRRWAVDGVTPRTQPREKVVDGAIVRDGDGNAVGGIRLPAMQVPVAAYNRTGDCVALDGRTEAFSSARLKRLYPTHQAYVSKVAVAVQRSVSAGVLTARDGAAILAQARSARVPS
jgi:hypothetical protein